jgi:hypothetical protein
MYFKMLTGFNALYCVTNCVSVTQYHIIIRAVSVSQVLSNRINKST